MRVTAKQIARELGISEASVSLALNNRPGVSARTRKRVLACARSLGYDLTRKERHDAHPKTIFLIRHTRAIHKDVPFFDELMGGIQSAVAALGIRLSVVTVDARSNIYEQLEDVRRAREAGAILLGTELLDGDWPPYSLLELPIVVLDCYLPNLDVDCVTINNHQGAYRATQLLLKESRGCPGRLVSTVSLKNFQERRDSFMSAVHEAGYSITRVITHTLGANVDDAERDMAAIIDRGDPLASCYLADFDQLAIGAVRAFSSRGIRVPEDISVIGFDDIEMARYLDPPLTTVHVNKQNLGYVAVTRLLQLFDQSLHEPLRIEVSATLMQRGTTL